MPIYAYLCGQCGHEVETLQKLSEPALTDCPACGRATLSKKLTAAGFQLKGSGWYATDFKGGAKTAKADPPAADAKADAKSDSSADAKTEAKSEPATTTAAPAGGCGTGCACH